jgi:hypothetical protein
MGFFGFVAAGFGIMFGIFLFALFIAFLRDILN